MIRPLPVDEGIGFRLLPPPSPGDVFFDMEGDPYFEPAYGLEYLFGLVTVDEGSPLVAIPSVEPRGREARLRTVHRFRLGSSRRFPDLHIYHYAAYEPTTLKRLMTEHATREDELDELLRREAFVDLFQVVRRSMRISHNSYSIKAVRQFFMPEAGKGAVTGGGPIDSRVPAVDGHRRSEHSRRHQRYNEEDCDSTLKLHRWRLDRRAEAAPKFGTEIAFRALPDNRD